jgi:hypothetical protein
MSIIADVLGLAGAGLLIMSVGFGFYLHRSRFSTSGMVGIVVTQGPEWRMQLLRDILSILGVFAPLSLTSLTIGVALGIGKVSQNAVYFGLGAFLTFLIAIVAVLFVLAVSSHSGRPVPLYMAPVGIALLVAGCGLSLISLAIIVG